MLAWPGVACGKACWLSLALFAGLVARGAAEEAPQLPPEDAVVPERYATGFEYAEGPALNPAGDLFVVNYRGFGNIGRIAADGTAAVFCNLDKIAPIEGRKAQANGLKLDAELRLIVADAGGARLLRIAADGKSAEVLADRFDNKRFNAINDVALDKAGNIYFSDPGGSSAENPIGAVYRYDISTKKVTQLAKELAFPNGLAVTPDQKQLVLAESQKYRLLIFDLTPMGKATNQRVLCEFPPDDKSRDRVDPDGLAFDQAGRCYVGTSNGDSIHVVELPSGKILRKYAAGGRKATNCHFHGEYLYVTIASKEAVYRLKLGVPGFAYVNWPEKPR